MLNAAWYLGLRHVSARLAQTEREYRRIWSVRVYFSSLGKLFDN
ncbi:hypothetical protein N0824_01261 [Microcystis sp. 0824]|nr:hypothetical protein N0824_01261 [Microcystis sp. 0824]